VYGGEWMSGMRLRRRGYSGRVGVLERGHGLLEGLFDGGCGESGDWE
jgi:hypothetical protein